MNWRAWASVMVPLTVIVGAIWLLALASYNGGNPTAATPLVAIPMGLVFAAFGCAFVTWDID